MKNVVKTKHVAAVFLSSGTLVPEDTENVCTTVDPQVDASRTWMTARYLYLDLDLLTRSHHLQYIYQYLSPSSTLYS